MVVYLAADEPIDPPYDPAIGGRGLIRPLPAEEAKRFRAFTKRYVHSLSYEAVPGRGIGCACGLGRPGTGDRRALVLLLEWALRYVPEFEFFYCCGGNEGQEPRLRDWCTPTELLHLWEFEGRELLVIARDA
jgi:hypothetical protein